MVSQHGRSGGGEAWCYREESGVHGLVGDGALDGYGIVPSRAGLPGGFSGVFEVGRVTASIPARPVCIEELLGQNQVGPLSRRACSG